MKKTIRTLSDLWSAFWQSFMLALLVATLAFAPAPALATISGTITITPAVKEIIAADLGTSPEWNMGDSIRFQVADGTGSGQASKVFQDKVTLAGSGSQSYDLDSTLTGPLGSVSFTRIYGIFAWRTDPAAAGTQDEILNVAGDFFLTKTLAANGDTLANVTYPIRPGGSWVHVSPDGTGTAVTAGTGDVLTFTNASAGDTVNFKILVLGS